jgi:hypothetical protein
VNKVHGRPFREVALAGANEIDAGVLQDRDHKRGEAIPIDHQLGALIQLEDDSPGDIPSIR